VEYAKIVGEVRKVLKAYRMKLTLRQIYYRLVSAQVIPNTRTSYQQLSKVLVKARERGDLNYKAIEDRSRQVLGVGDFGYESPDDFLDYQIQRLKESGENYSRPLWSAQPHHVLVVLEKDALSRVFMTVANRYRVKVFPTRGYASFTYVKTIIENLEDDKPNIVLHFGDFDPSGRDIERDLTKRLVSYGAKNLVVKHIALTEAQIKDLNLPAKPEDLETLKKLERDPRAKRYGLDYAVELDALDPKLLTELIEDSISEEINVGLWTAQLRQIELEKTSLVEKLKNVKVSFTEER